MSNRRRLVVKLERMIRHAMCHHLQGLFPLYVVTEYPRSGGTWFSQMLADALGVPFPRNEFPRLTSQIMHGHYPYDPRLNGVFLVVRDGRDVMVSFYYHSLIKNERGNAPLVERTRRALGIDDPENIQEHLPAFLEYSFGDEAPLGFSWSEFVTDWLGREAVVMVKYEDMLDDAAATVKEAISQGVGVDVPMDTLKEIEERYSFERLAKRKRGQEKTSRFLRKGVAGDWRGKFSAEAKHIFDQYAGDVLITLGYEANHEWAER